eukprot:2926971-Alexandrium_andersonii.AAC.1
MRRHRHALFRAQLPFVGRHSELPAGLEVDGLHLGQGRNGNGERAVHLGAADFKGDPFSRCTAATGAEGWPRRHGRRGIRRP